MSPNIEAPLVTGCITGATAVLVAIAGFVHAGRISRENWQAELQRQRAARTEAAYQQAAAYLLYRREERLYYLNRELLDTKTRRYLRKLLATYDASWFEMNAQLVLFASDTVKDAGEEANGAHREVMRRARELKRHDDRIRAIVAEQGSQAIPTALVSRSVLAKDRLQEAVIKASDVDQALIDAMSAEMSAGPSAKPRGRLKRKPGRQDQPTVPPPSQVSGAAS